MVRSIIMKQFLDDVQGIKMDIAAVAEAREQVTKLGKQADSELSESDIVKLQTSISNIIEKTNGSALECLRQLRVLKEKKNAENVKDCDLRMQEFVIDTLFRTFAVEMAQVRV